MSVWNKTIKIKHLFTEDEDHESIQNSMDLIADELNKHDEFSRLNFSRFRNIPKNNEWCTPLEAANKLLNEIYNIADKCRIWIE
jgi:hypothetical protein